MMEDRFGVNHKPVPLKLRWSQVVKVVALVRGCMPVYKRRYTMTFVQASVCAAVCSNHWTVWSHRFLSQKLALCRHLNVILLIMWRRQTDLMHRASPTSNTKTVSPPTPHSWAPAIPSLSVKSPSDAGIPSSDADSLGCLTVCGVFEVNASSMHIPRCVLFITHMSYEDNEM